MYLSKAEIHNGLRLLILEKIEQKNSLTSAENRVYSNLHNEIRNS